MISDRHSRFHHSGRKFSSVKTGPSGLCKAWPRVCVSLILPRSVPLPQISISPRRGNHRLLFFSGELQKSGYQEEFVLVNLVTFRMADYGKEGEETSARGVDWEVVSLTASAYAAAPGPEGVNLVDYSKDKEFNKNEEYARAMFMSGHFVFPPNEHENLPVERDDTDMIEVEADVPEKTQEENWTRESISEVSDLHVQFFDKGERLCAHGVELEEGKTSLQGLTLVEEVKSMSSDAGFSSFHTETDVGGSVLFDENKDISEADDPINRGQGCSPKSINKSKHNLSRIPSESWWKRQAAFFYAHAKEASTFWSLCVAAALMGVVILGQRWQRERWQVLQTRSLSISDEKMSRLLGPVTRFKDVIVGSHRRGPVLQAGSSSGL